MTAHPDSALPSLVADSFAASLKAGQITLYDFASVSPVTDDPSSGPSDEDGAGAFKQFVHVVPDLVDKPAVPLKTPDLSKVGKRDPFEGPEFGPGEHVCDLKQNGAKYSAVHNLHALFPEHFMAIPHFGPRGTFRPQTSDLVPEDLAVAWRIVEAYERAEREAVCFFNGGPLAGASQAHLHLQFTPFQHGCPPACEALARSLPFPPSPPVPDSLLSAGPATAPAAAAAAARLPLPWVHFYLPIPPRPSPSSSSATSETDRAAFHTSLYDTYTALLTTSHSFLSSLPPSALPPAGPKRDSYNLFLTSRHMHLIPRTDRLVRVPRIASVGQGPAGGEGEREMRLSVNGLLFLGYWFVGSEEEESDLRKHGLERTLREAGYANGEWDERERWKEAEGEGV
ncbi:hypothetical protein JCM6882_009382 [Rhodosporidiobolus microsporus]